MSWDAPNFPQPCRTKRNNQLRVLRGTLKNVMALFLKQNGQRSQLQSKIAADLAERVKTQKVVGGEEPGAVMLEESQEATGRSLFWVGVITMAVAALVVFVLFIFNGV